MVTTSLITGDVPLPNGDAAVAAELEILLSGYDTEGDETIWPTPIRVVLEGVSIPSGVELWRNTEGTRGRHYLVTGYVYFSGLNGRVRRVVEFPPIQVGDESTYTFAELLDATPFPTPTTSYWMSITQQQYDDMEGWKDDAEAAAAAADADRIAAEAAAIAAAGTPTFANIAAVEAATIANVQTITVGGQIYVRDDTDGAVTSDDGKKWLLLDFRGRFDTLVSDMLQGSTRVIAAYGDSTTDGTGTTGWTANPVDGGGAATGAAPHTPAYAWPTVAQAALRSMFLNNNITVTNAGYAGKQILDGWAYANYQNAVRGPYANPHAVIVSFGINDVWQVGFTPAAFETQLLLLCRKIARYGAFPIFQLPDEPSDERYNGWILGKVREVYRSVAARLGVKIIDWGTAMNQLSQCSDGTGWRWGADQPDDIHGNDALHSVKGGYIAASIYPHTLWVTEPITDVAPWSRYCNPIDGYSVVQAVMNKFGGCMIVPASSYALDQNLLSMWVWSVGAARQMYWAAVDANNYFSPRTVANAPLIAMYDYAAMAAQTITAPASASLAGPTGGKDAESLGRVFRVPNGLSRWTFRAPRDVITEDVYLGYFSIREVEPVFAQSLSIYDAAASPTIFDRDSEGDIPQVFGFQHNRTLNLNIEIDLDAGMGVCLWSSRVYGGTTSRANNRKHGLFLYRHPDGRLFLYQVVFHADGTIATSTSLGSSSVLTWSGQRRLRIVGGVNGTPAQYLSVFDGWSSNSAIIAVTNNLTNEPWPWGGTPGAVWQHTAYTGVAALTMFGAV